MPSLPVLPDKEALCGGQRFTIVCITVTLTPSTIPIPASQKFPLESHPLVYDNYALPTFLKEIPDWAKFKELRFINRYDWIAVLFLALGCYFLGEWATSSMDWDEWTSCSPGVSFPHRLALPCYLLGQFSPTCLGRRNMIPGTRVGIIGLYLLLLLGKAGTTTITFFLVPPARFYFLGTRPHLLYPQDDVSFWLGK